MVLSDCRGSVDKREALENLDLILLCIDEIVDGGYCSLSVLNPLNLFIGLHFSCLNSLKSLGCTSLIISKILSRNLLITTISSGHFFPLDITPIFCCRIVLETDANVITGKVASHSMDAGASLSEQVSFPLR